MSQLSEGPIYWLQDLNGSASSTAFPAASTNGVAKESLATSPGPGRGASRVHVAVRAEAASGALTATVHLIGYANRGALSSAPMWTYLGSMNGGTAMAVDTTKWSPNSSTIAVSEVFSVSADNYERLATVSISPGGSSPLVSTWIGFALQ
jgi:hypothetical protein